MKRLLVIMLIFVAVGLVSADIIKIKTDLFFNINGITVEAYSIYDTNPAYGIVGHDFWSYNSVSRELTVRDFWTYRITINGTVLMDNRPGQIIEGDIAMRFYDYYLIERWFSIKENDPGTPITQ